MSERTVGCWRTLLGSLHAWVAGVFGLKRSCGAFGSEGAANVILPQIGPGEVEVRPPSVAMSRASSEFSLDCDDCRTHFQLSSAKPSIGVSIYGR